MFRQHPRGFTDQTEPVDFYGTRLHYQAQGQMGWSDALLCISWTSEWALRLSKKKDRRRGAQVQHVRICAGKRRRTFGAAQIALCARLIVGPTNHPDAACTA